MKFSTCFAQVRLLGRLQVYSCGRTERLGSTPDCSIQLLPLEEAADRSLPDIDLEVPGHEKSAEELKVDISEFGERLVNVKRGIKSLCIVPKLLFGFLEGRDDFQSVARGFEVGLLECSPGGLNSFIDHVDFGL